MKPEQEESMNIFTKILSVLVALEFLYIFYLETIATTSDKTSNVFGMTKDELGQKNVNVLFKNQGVYNGLLSVLILLAVFVFASKAAVICLMAYIVAVALYGSFTSNPNRADWRSSPLSPASSDLHRYLPGSRPQRRPRKNGRGFRPLRG